MIGTEISHYKILSKLGQGGMGHVYLAEDTLLGRQAAIKLLAPEFNRDDGIKERFKREARAVAALNHQNIVTIYEFGHFDDNPYIVMEYVDGESLREIQRKSKQRTDEIINIVLQICAGLAKSHETGIIHRDLKPENILLDKDYRVKILDFGLAKLRSHENITQKSMRIGTINYMSPEQLQGKEVDAQSDIFSLGIILYELFTGHMPFSGEYEASIIFSILNNTPPPLNEYNSSLPEPLQNIIDRALAKEKSDRYKSVNELAADISALGAKPRNVIPPVDSSQTESVEELLEHRHKIDRLIESKYKKPIVILFSDIVGSTQFFEQRGDIEGRAMVRRHHHSMFPVIQKFGGSVIKTIGDGIMVSLPQVKSACLCAREMQLLQQKENLNMAPEDRISIRIAMHYGRAVIEENDVYGDAVNVASRVEKYTGGNQIMISQAMVDELVGDQLFETVPAGSVSMKGKTDKMSLYRLRWFDGEKIEVIPATDSEISGSSTPVPVIKTGNVKINKPFRLVVNEEIKREALSDELKNPYMNRVMIQDINEFYGRKSEVEKIYSRIGSSRPQSISLVGERRIGKSSLLNYINNPVNRKKYLKNPDEYIFIFVDFQERRGIKIPDFFAIIFDALLEAFNGTLEIDLEPDYEGFKKVISEFEAQNLKLIMLFDEFELVTKNTNFGSEFYSYCRSIANNYNVAYIVSSGRNLQTLCHSKQISDSPFFNIFSNLTLSQFQHEEAVSLIRDPATKLDYALDSYTDLVLDIAGYYPFFIQMACAPLFEQVKIDAIPDKSMQESVKDEFLDEAKVHFQQIWQTLEQDQKDVMLAICQNKKIQPSQVYLVKALKKQGYIKSGRKGEQIFSSLFREYILNRFAGGSGKSRKSTAFFWPFSGKAQH